MTAARSDDAEVRVARMIDAPRERVYEAWTTPSLLRQWWGPGGFTCPEAEVDLQPGGRYRLVMQPPGGERMIVTGIYHEIVAPSLLVYTWQWESGPEDPGHESLVTVEFRDHGERTEVIVSHGQFPAAHDLSPYRTGWEEGLGKLDLHASGRAAHA